MKSYRVVNRTVGNRTKRVRARSAADAVQVYIVESELEFSEFDTLIEVTELITGESSSFRFNLSVRDEIGNPCLISVDLSEEIGLQ